MMWVAALGVCLLVALVSGVTRYEDILDEFKAFKANYDKAYTHAIEEQYRMMIYADNKHTIEEHNARYELGLETYRMATNQYSDWLQHEFLLHKMGLEIDEHEEELDGSMLYVSLPNVTVPETVDWVQAGAVTEPKNQGHCGSCWTFSSTGALEGQHFRKTGKLVSLSEQNLIDCVPDTQGCRGGDMISAFEYVKRNGIDTEESYPYESANGTSCRFSKESEGARCSGYVRLPAGQEARLAEALAAAGPVSVAIDAKHVGFRHYSSGVYYDKNCSKQPKHAVLVVGYGKTREGEAYWLVKNSWGSNWGLNGYIMMAKDRDNHCGITSYAIYPTI